MPLAHSSGHSGHLCVVWSFGPPHGTPTMVHRAHIAPRSSRPTLIQVLVGLDSEDQWSACLATHFAGLGIFIAACASCSRPQPKIRLRPRVRLRSLGRKAAPLLIRSFSLFQMDPLPGPPMTTNPKLRKAHRSDGDNRLNFAAPRGHVAFAELALHRSSRLVIRPHCQHTPCRNPRHCVSTVQRVCQPVMVIQTFATETEEEP